MAENKTKPTTKSVPEYLKSLEDPGRREDCLELDKLMEEITGSEGRMWGDSIIGYGDYRYKYASGREGDWFLTGFASRKQTLTIYVMGYLEYFPAHLEKLGKHRTGKGCLYIKKLSDIDLKVLRDLLQESIKRLKNS